MERETKVHSLYNESRTATFEASEYFDRWRRAREQLLEAKLDALLVTSEMNYTYFTGHDSPAWVIKSRPMIFLLPLEDEPAIITTFIAETKELSPIHNLYSYVGFESDACKMVEDVIRELGLDRGNIGCELGVEQRLGISYNEFRSLQANLPQVNWVDATAQLWHLRIRKSPAELGYLRTAGRLQSAAYQALLPYIRSGISELELFRIFARELVENGMEPPGYVAMHSGLGNYGRVSCWPTCRTLIPGDLWFMDNGATFHGYWTDFGRTVAIGKAAKEQKRDYSIAYNATQAALQAVRPGVPVSEIRLAADAVLDAEGIPMYPRARIGHGIGLDITEPPSILEVENELLEPGMVLAIEPRIDREYGHFQTEENFVVTEQGFELLSQPQSPELLEV
jgi:Xaa-Pro aminopeptidase